MRPAYICVSAVAIVSALAIAPVYGLTQEHVTVANYQWSKHLSSEDLSYFEMIRSAVHSRDARWLSEQVLYPLSFYKLGKKINIKNSREFFRNYSELFPEGTVSTIERQDPPRLLKTERGIGVGRGELWFSYLLDGSNNGLGQYYIISMADVSGVAK